MLPKDELVAALDEALDEARYRLRCQTDEALAKKLGISTKTVSFWRNGRWTTADAALITILISTRSIPIPQPV